MDLKTLAAAIERKTAEMAAFYEKNRDNFTAEVRTEWAQRNDELKGMREEFQALRQIEQDLSEGGEFVKRLGMPGQLPAPAADTKEAMLVRATKDAEILQTKGLGRYAFEQGLRKGAEIHLPISVKTLFATTAGYAPEILRNRPDLSYAVRPLNILDLIPTFDIAQPGVKYMEETTFTNAAAETAEGGTMPESALAYTEKSAVVQKIATYIPVTDEQLDDVSYIEQRLNERLGYMIRQRLEGQIIAGNGTAPNLRGITAVAGIQTQAKATDTTLDAFLKAHTKLEISPFTEPNIDLLHPTDWQNIRLLKDSQNRYLMGDPYIQGPMYIFGVPVAKSVALTAGTAIVQDTKFLELDIYRGLDIMMGFINDDFIKGRQAIRATIRVTFFNYRPTSTCTVTGL